MMRLKRILVMDREKLLVDLIGRALTNERVQVVSANCCDEAKAMMGKEPVDLLLMDPGIPSASEWIAEMKASNTPTAVVLFTNSPQQEAEATTADIPFVRKSGDLSDLLQTLELRMETPLAKPGSRRILIVDDDPDVSKFVRACLTDGGYFVSSATNGREALEILDKNPNISLVLLDIMMPEKGGIDTLCEIEKMKSPPAVIIMSGVCDSAIAEIALKEGASDYITKPLDAVKVLSAVDAAVAHIDYVC